MSATVPCYVRVQVKREEWRLVEAVTLTDAENKACSDDESIIKVISCQYDQPEDYWDTP